MRDVRFYFNGQAFVARDGQTVAMALWSAGIHTLRTSPRRNEARGMFCGMGVCQECVVWIHGRRCESCLTVVREEMSVSSQPNDRA